MFTKRILVVFSLLLLAGIFWLTPGASAHTSVDTASQAPTAISIAVAKEVRTAIYVVEKKKKHHHHHTDASGFFSISPSVESLNIDSMGNGQADFTLLFHDAFGHATFDLGTTLPDGCLSEALPSSVSTDAFGNKSLPIHIEGIECVEGHYEISATENFTPFRQHEVDIYLTEPGT